MKRLRTLGVVGLLIAAAVHAQAAEDWLSARVLADREALVRGEAFRLAVILDIAPGYHINANPPSADRLVPTGVKPENHPAIEWGEVQYPKGKPLAAEWAAGGSVSVYSGRAIIIVGGRVTDEAPPGETAVRLTLTYQGCDENTCFRPASRRIETPVPIVEKGTASAPANQEVFAEAE
ncbi:MAG: protein-disulfide reductase DsbD domain-containing protein, partial [Phycisphaerae bacterium]